MNVRDFGAVGDGVTDDTAAIQRANDAVAATGGRVFFPAGTYIAGGVLQDSYVEFYGSRDAVLKHPNGLTPSSIISSRRYTLVGTIEAGSQVLSVSTGTQRIRPGSPLAILGAAGTGKYLYSVATNVGGISVTLDLAAPFGVLNAKIYVGAIRPSIRGLTLDGNKPEAGSTTQNAVPVNYLLARGATVADTLIVNGEHGAITFGTGTVDSVIEGNTLLANGDPALSTDAAIWCFQGCSRNVIRNNVIGGASERGIFIDDQTTVTTAWDAPSDDNLIENNEIDIPPAGWNAGMIIAGSNGNTVRNNVFKNVPLAIAVEDSTQGPRRTSQNNTVSGNSFYSHERGVQVVASGNTFSANTFVETVKPYVITGTNVVN